MWTLKWTMALPMGSPGKIWSMPPKSKTATKAPATPEVPAPSPKGRIKRGQTRSDGQTDVKVPQRPNGNTKNDIRWLEEQVELGLIEPIAEDENDIPFGALRRWTGDTLPSAEGSYWILPKEDKRCHGMSKIRDHEGRYVIGKDNKELLRPCARPTIIGGDVCVAHGGGVEHVRNAANLRLLAAADSVIGALIVIAMDTKEDSRARVQAINSVLDRAGVKGTLNVSIEVSKYKEMMKEMFSGDWGSSEGDD
jgi:hypothetical protein